MQKANFEREIAVQQKSDEILDLLCFEQGPPSVEQRRVAVARDPEDAGHHVAIRWVVREIC